MNGWTTQDGTPTPEAPVSIVSAGTKNQENGEWEYEITITNVQTDPDKNQTVTLTADRPLTKWDKLTKKDGQWGWEYKSAEIVCDGSETWFLTGVTSDEYQGFALRSSDYNAMKSNLILVCDRFAYSKSDKINTCRQENSEYGLRFIVSTEYVPNKTVAEFKNWLQSNPITVLYHLAEPVFTPLSEAEQEQMNALHTNRPTTVLSNDAGCEMALTYKTRKGVGGNLLDLDDPSFVLTNCIYVSKYSVKCNIVDSYYSNISNYNLNDLIKRNIGKNIIFSCDGNPEGRRIGIVLHGSYLDGSTAKEINTATGKEIKLNIEDATEFTRIDLRINRSPVKITDTETIISNLSLKIE